MRDIAVVTCYFNPVGYRSKTENYEAFADALRRTGIRLTTVECAFGNKPFALPNVTDLIRYRSESVLWQRERLVNLAVAQLPQEVQYVAWIDCDLLFTNLHWAKEARNLLQDVSIVQLYERCIRLPKGESSYSGDGKISVSFASVTLERPEVLARGSHEKHGITGGAWMARREIFQTAGLYEHAIVGGADDYIAHAIYGDVASDCVLQKMHYNPSLVTHYQQWAIRFYGAVQGKVGVVRGDVHHLWHGELQNRKYFDRHDVLDELGYDPARDIDVLPNQPLEWSARADQKLRVWLRSYFLERKEDE